MTERERPDPPDEPVIGGVAPGAAYDPSASQWDGYSDTTAAIGEPQVGDAWDGADYDDSAYDGSPYDDPYADQYDDYYESEPARQPLFYIFIGLAVLLGGLLVFLLFQVLGGSGNGDPAPPPPDFNVSIDRPLNDERVDTGSDVEVQVRANATEPISRLELLLGGDVVDQEAFTTAPSDGIYSALLEFSVDEPGTYEIAARAVSESGATQDSATVRIIAVERIDDRPSRITGEIISTVNARQGPGDEFTADRTLDTGTVVAIVGRTRDSQWLLLEDGTWIRRAAVQLSDSLDLVDVTQPTATPAPTATATPEPEPSPSPSPAADAPDLSPVNATLDSGGSVLRVSISNLSSSGYEGPLVVRITGLGDAVLEQVFSVGLGPNSTQAVEFTLNQPQQSSATVQVNIDPDGQVDELSEDNNIASFVLAPPVSAPDIVIADASITDNAIRVTITNVGGDMGASDVVVTVALGGIVNSASLAGLELASADSQSFVITRPDASGSATITVTVNGQPLASSTLDIPAPGPAPTTAP